MGSCANGGGYYHYSYSVVRGCDRASSMEEVWMVPCLLGSIYRYRTRRHLRAWVPSYRRGPPVWHAAAPAEDEAKQEGCPLVRQRFWSGEKVRSS